MGHPTGFRQWPRRLPKKRERIVRVGDWKEFVALYAESPVSGGESAKQQGGRCMDCGVPFCMQGCPLGNRIPDWNDLVYRERWQAAWNALDDTNNFPEFTGRLCPAPCEAACVLNVNQDAVTIEMLEKEIVEHAFAAGWVVPRPPRVRTGKKIAVVGSGPAGLAAAAQLNAVGHTVTIFEKADQLGGLLRYGIPDFKMEKHVIDRRLAILAAEGVTWRTGIEIGKDLSWSELKLTHDAVLVAIGAEVPRELDVPGRELGGVVLAMDYLIAQNRVVAAGAGVSLAKSAPSEARSSEWGRGPTEKVEPLERLPATNSPIDAKGKRVVVLGGGDTGSDCVGTAHRQGAASVTQLELMPAPPDQRAVGNPWPQWPQIFRTSSSQEEGGERQFALQTTHLTGRDGRLQALHAAHVRPVRGPGGELGFEREGGAELTLPCDLLVLAMGFVSPVAAGIASECGVTLTARGTIAVDREFRTNVRGIYAAGDAQRGASLIVWAISDGREAARAIDIDLLAEARGPDWRGSGALPTRGGDASF